MSAVNRIFFGIFADAAMVEGSIPVIKAIKQKYPEAKLVYGVAKDLAVGLVGAEGIDEIMQANSPAEIFVAGYTGGFDRVYVPMLYNNEQSQWMFESKWIKAAPFNTVSDYIAYRCLDDIVITDRDSIPVPKKEEPTTEEPAKAEAK